jgi:hypothetical protein
MMNSQVNLDQYPFLQAGLEDYAFVSRIVSGKSGNARHAVCLMHDAIEFTLYEVLRLVNHDIYSSGQNTIGLDAALTACQKLGIEVPLVDTVRVIQKHRGDAKHHAQTPHENAYRKMIGEFRVIMSRLVHEQFGQALGQSIYKLGLLPYHTALYDLYKKYRTHNWKLALRFITGAFLHKHRSILKLNDDFLTGKTQDVYEIIKKLESEMKTASYPQTSADAIQFIQELPTLLRTHIQANELDNATEIAGKAYSRLDEIFPTIFDIREAKQITPCLFLPQRLRLTSMSWSKWQQGDTNNKKQHISELQTLLRKNRAFVETFGPSYYDEDDDRYWRWWEFAIFDGSRWHTFHMDDDFSLSLESGGLDTDEGERREAVAKLIFDEFKKAVDDFAKSNSVTE